MASPFLHCLLLHLCICTCHCLAFSALLCLVLHLCICISLVVFLYLHYCLVLPTRHWQACHGLTFPAWFYIQLHLYLSFCTCIFVFLFLFGHVLYSALFSNRTTLVHLPVLHLAHRWQIQLGAITQAHCCRPFPSLHHQSPSNWCICATKWCIAAWGSS